MHSLIQLPVKSLQAIKLDTRNIKKEYTTTKSLIEVPVMFARAKDADFGLRLVNRMKGEGIL